MGLDVVKTDIIRISDRPFEGRVRQMGSKRAHVQKRLCPFRTLWGPIWTCNAHARCASSLCWHTQDVDAYTLLLNIVVKHVVCIKGLGLCRACTACTCVSLM